MAEKCRFCGVLAEVEHMSSVYGVDSVFMCMKCALAVRNAIHDRGAGSLEYGLVEVGDWVRRDGCGKVKYCSRFEV